MWPFLSRIGKSPGARPDGGRRPGALSGALDTGAPEASLRRPPCDADFVLALETDLWLLRLPPKVRPQALIEQFPRVANRVARDWPDAFLRDFCFEDLLVDRRGGRRGFPPEVRRDLVRLQKFSERHGALIDEQRRRQQLGTDSQPAIDTDSGIDSDGGLDWTPSETIVVTSDQLRR